MTSLSTAPPLPGRRPMAAPFALGVLCTVAWFGAFPLSGRYDWADIAMEAAYFVAAALGFVFIHRQPILTLEAGWLAFLVSLLLEVYDEFTVEPDLWGEYATGLLGVSGLFVLGRGLYLSVIGTEQLEERRRSAEQALIAAREESEAANRELRKAVEQRDEVVSIVAHDFRSPLTLIQGYAEMLEARAPTPETAEILRTIRHRAQNLAALAADTLTMSRIDSGTLQLERAPVRLDEIVHTALASRASIPGVRVVAGEVAKDVVVQADALRVGQVVENLVDNAAKYAPRDSTVTVSLRRVDGGVEVAVADEGPGIAAEDMPRLFQRFSRLGQPREIPGTGLGLFICRSIVEAHGGRIGVDSAPGRGSTFRFSLPLADSR